MTKIIDIIELINLYSPCFDILLIFLIIIFINHYETKKTSLTGKELYEFDTISENAKWFIENEKNLKEYEDEYMSIKEANILELEIVRINKRINENSNRIKVNASFLDYVLQIILLLISYGLGVGVLENILQVNNDIFSKEYGVIANIISTILFGTLFIDAAIFIVAVPCGVTYFCFKNIMKRKDKQNQELILFNEQLEIRKVALKNRIND